MKHSTVGLITAFLLGGLISALLVERFAGPPTPQTITIDKPVFIIPMDGSVKPADIDSSFPARPSNPLGSTLGPI